MYINVNDLSGVFGYTMTTIYGGGLFGFHIDGGGDINGDGFDDFVIATAPVANDPGVFVVFGTADRISGISMGDLDGTNGFRIENTYIEQGVGQDAAIAGDINGDGYDDLVISAAWSNTVEPRNNGEAFVIFGGASGFAADFDLTALDGTNGFHIIGATGINEGFGYTVSNLGDINDDGIDDLIIASRGANIIPNNNSSNGASYVVFGSTSVFSATLDVNDLDGTDGFLLYFSDPRGNNDAISSSGSGGYEVSDAGDVNGDGIQDMLIGVPSTYFRNASNQQESRGISFVVFGSDEGFSASTNLYDLDGTDGFSITQATGDYLGYSISSAGDMNGDGIDDIIVSDPTIGDAFVIFGSASAFSSTFDLASLNGTNGFRIDGGSTNSAWRVSNVGDINGDGFDDVALGRVGSTNADAFVVFGKAAGWSSTLDLQNIGTDGLRFGSDLPGGNGIGYDIAAAGDVNGDGVDDLLITGRVGSEVLIFYGSVGLGSQTITTLDDNPNTFAGTSGTDQVFGLDGNDTLSGDDGDDKLNGGEGHDIIDGGAGNDELAGGRDNDTITTGTGFDIVFGGSGNDLINISPDGSGLINGGLGQDIVEVTGLSTQSFSWDGDAASPLLNIATPGGSYAVTEVEQIRRHNAVDNVVDDLVLLGTDGADGLSGNARNTLIIIAGAGDDLLIASNQSSFNSLWGGNGDDELRGQAGDDFLYGGADNDTLNGGGGADVIDGGSGFDTVDYSGSSARVIVNLFTGTGSGAGSHASGDTYASIEAVQGSTVDDILVGRDGASDTLRGGNGNDSLRANGDDDFVYGEGGNDLIFAGFGADTIDGGDGIDTLMLTNASAGAIIRLDLGTGSFNVAQGDTYTNVENVAGSAFRDLLYGDDGVNFLDGRGGNDLLIGNGGADTLDGGDGFDTVSYANSASGITASLASGTGPENDIIREVEHLVGSAFGDFLYGDDNVNLLEGGAGNDLLVGNGGVDTLNGGDGFDTVSYANSVVGITASLFLGTGPGGDIIQNVEHLVGSNFNDLLVGNDGADETLDGGGGADSLRGNGGNDTLNGGNGNDILFSGFGNDAHDGGAGFDTINYSQASAGVIVRLDLGTGSLGHAAGDTYVNIENITGSSAFRDLLYGNEIGNIIDGRGGNDLLIGNGGSDTLIGGNGFDKLDGGTGFDVLTGGSGNDTFVFKAGYQADRITDFTIGEDQVDLTSFGFTTYSQVSSLMYTSGADTVLTFGGGDAIRLVGISLGDLTASDFIITAPPGNAPAEKAAFAPANDSFDFADDFGTQDPSMAFMQQELMAEWDASQAMNVPIYKTNDYGVLEIFTPDDIGYDWDALTA